jgi:hypothetical protein
VFGLPFFELLPLAGEVVLGLREAATALVQLALAPLEGGVAVVQAISARLARTSASASSLIFSAASLAARSASRRLVSASRSASWMMEAASERACVCRLSTRDR